MWCSRSGQLDEEGPGVLVRDAWRRIESYGIAPQPPCSRPGATSPGDVAVVLVDPGSPITAPAAVPPTAHC